MCFHKALLELTVSQSQQGFPSSSAGKESASSVGDSSSVSGLGRSAGEGIGYPLQYSWASLVAQMVKNLPAMWETRVWSLGWEGPLGKGMATYTSILAWRIPWTQEPGGLQSVGSQRVGHDWATNTHTHTHTHTHTQKMALQSWTVSKEEQLKWCQGKKWCKKTD